MSQDWFLLEFTSSTSTPSLQLLIQEVFFYAHPAVWLPVEACLAEDATETLYELRIIFYEDQHRDRAAAAMEKHITELTQAGQRG